MRTHALRTWLWTLLSIWLTGCATTPPAAFYTLAPLPAAERGNSTAMGQSPAIGVGPINFPVFLERAQLVARSGSSLLTVDELHRWAGSLQDDFPRVLGENLAHLLNTSRVLLHTAEVRYPLDFRVVADVLRFEGTAQGEAVLKVRWAVLDPYSEAALLVREGSYRSRAGSSEQAAMVEAMSRALGDFSREVAEGIQRLPRPKRPPPETDTY